MIPSSAHYQLFYSSAMDKFLAEMIVQKNKNEFIGIVENQKIKMADKKAA